MNEIGGRRLLVILLLIHFVLLSRQFSQGHGAVPLVERLAVRLMGPPARALAGVDHFVGELSDGWRTRARLEEENRELRAQVSTFERDELRHQSLELEFERLARALEYSRSEDRPLRVADVVYVDYASWLRSLVIFVGARDARVNQPVVDTNGLVGRVITVSGGYARVQLVTDRAAGVGAMIERTGRQGVTRGAGEEYLLMEFVPLQADVQVGDRIVTAGMDGVYPRGIPVGIVRSIEPGRNLFHLIEAVPLADFGHLDQVYLLEEVTVPAELQAEPGDDRP